MFEAMKRSWRGRSLLWLLPLGLLGAAVFAGIALDYLARSR